MSTIIQPSKQSVRAYLERRSHDSAPPPAPDEIRRQLGWGLALPGCQKIQQAVACLETQYR